MDDKCDFVSNYSECPCCDQPSLTELHFEVHIDGVDRETCRQIALRLHADAIGDACCRELERLESKRGER